MRFSDRLTETRKKRGLSQSDLAGFLNTKPTTIGRYERGETTPSIEVALKLANFLGVSLDFLSGNTDLELDQNTLNRIEDISKMQSNDRSFILRAIDALVRDLKAQEAYA